MKKRIATALATLLVLGLLALPVYADTPEVTPVEDQGQEVVLEAPEELPQEDAEQEAAPEEQEAAPEATEAAPLGAAEQEAEPEPQGAGLAEGETFSPEGDPLTYVVLSADEMTVAVTGGEPGMTSVTIPATVTYNGVTYKVTEIAKKAFAEYTTITELTFAPNSNLVAIREDAFAYKGKDDTIVPATISTLTFPASLEVVEDGAFHCIPVEHFALEDGSKLTAIPNGFLAADGADGTPGVQTECRTLWDYINKVWIDFTKPYPYTPKQVAEACACLRSIDLGEANMIVRIGDGAFKNQGNLTSIDFGTPVNEFEVGYGAFAGAGNNGYLVEQGIDDELNDGIETLFLPANLAKMGSGSFRLARVKNVVFEDGSKLKEVGYSFMGIDGSDAMPSGGSYIPQSVISAANCLETVSFGEGNHLTSINSGAFRNQSHMTSIDFGSPVNELEVSYGAFLGVGNNGYLVEQGIDDTPNAGIEMLRIPANLTYLRNGCFRLASVRNIEFEDGSKLENLEYSFMSIDGPDGMPGYDTYVPSCVINAANCLETVSFGDGNHLSNISSGSFRNQSHLTSIDFGSPVNELEISYGAFVGVGNNGYLVEQGIDDTPNAGIETLTFPANLTLLSNGCFRLASVRNLVFEDGCKLERIDYSLLVIDGLDCMPGCDTYPPSYVINAANTLETVSFGEGNHLTIIESGSFKNQSHLTSIDFGSPVNDLAVSYGAFLGAGDNDYLVEQGIDNSQNPGIETLTLPVNLAELRNGSFRYTRAEEIVCEDGCKLTELDGGAFSNCDRLTTVDLRGSNITAIEDALKENPKLECVYFPETLEAITWRDPSNEKNCPFYDCGALNELHFAATDPSGYRFTDDALQFLPDVGTVFLPEGTPDDAVEEYVEKLTAAGLTFGEQNWHITTSAPFTVTFEANGGTGKMRPKAAAADVPFTLPACGFTAPKGKVFDRWDAGAPGDTITVTGDVVLTAQWKDEVTLIPIYRMYNTKTSEHLWTKSKKEYESCGKGNYRDWRQENVAWYSPNLKAPATYAQSTQGDFVYVWRLYDKGRTGDHIYLTYGAEMKSYLSNGWVVDKGAGFWTLRKGATISGRKTIPIYRAYNPKLKRGKHHYTPSKTEYDTICKKHGWKPEGVKFYVIKK